MNKAYRSNSNEPARHNLWFPELLDPCWLAGSLGLSGIRPQLTAAILLLRPRNDGNRRRYFPCSAFSLTCYA